MKRLSVLATILVVLAGGVLPAVAITGGDLDAEGHPNVGAIMVPHPMIGPIPFCSGTLIAPRVLLTAGHCTFSLQRLMPVWNFMVEDVHISFDSDDVYSDYDDQAIPAAEVITHPQFVPNPGGMGIGVPDVGILILEEPAPEEIQPATLPDEGLLDSLRVEGKLRQQGEAAMFTVVGYGTTLEWPPPVIVRPDGVRRVAQSKFLNLRKTWLHMSQNQAPGQENGGSGYGDSGGPTFWTDEDGTEVLVAVTSWGDMMAVATGTAWRIDIPTSMGFVENAIE
jgi:hypothetical protein